MSYYKLKIIIKFGIFILNLYRNNVGIMSNIK